MGARVLSRVGIGRFLVSFLVAGALGAEASPGEPLPSAPDACALLTAGEIESALGIPPGPGTGTRVEPEVSLCRWPTADELDDLLYVIFAPRTVASAADLRARLAQSIGEPQEFRLVEGVGDFAVWISLMGEPGALQVYEREFLLQVGVEAEVEDGPAAARSVAEFALTRLAAAD